MQSLATLCGYCLCLNLTMFIFVGGNCYMHNDFHRYCYDLQHLRTVVGFYVNGDHKVMHNCSSNKKVNWNVWCDVNIQYPKGYKTTFCFIYSCLFGLVSISFAYAETWSFAHSSLQNSWSSVEHHLIGWWASANINLQIFPHIPSSFFMLVFLGKRKGFPPVY